MGSRHFRDEILDALVVSFLYLVHRAVDQRRPPTIERRMVFRPHSKQSEVDLVLAVDAVEALLLIL
jgi:hypothetical protein